MKKIMLAATVGAGLVTGLAGAAGAQTPCASYPDPCASPLVEPEELPVAVESGGLGGIEVKGKQQLPVTGSEASAIAAAGAILVAGGGVLVWRSKAAPTT